MNYLSEVEPKNQFYCI